MCGLVGVVSTTDLTLNERKVFNQLLQADYLRGNDSFGIFRFPVKGQQTVYAKSTAHPVYADVVFPEYLAAPTLGLLGHNRAATQGAVTNENAHPFSHGQVTLIHNGTLRSNAGLPKEFEVDSEGICYMLSQVAPDEAAEALGKLDGAFALIWYDHRDESLNIAKNDQRPLHVTTYASALYIASSKHMLAYVLEHNRIPITGIEAVPNYKHIKLSKGSILRKEVADIPEKKHVVDHDVGIYGSGGTWYGRQNSSKYSRKSPVKVVVAPVEFIASTLQGNKTGLGVFRVLGGYDDYDAWHSHDLTAGHYVLSHMNSREEYDSLGSKAMGNGLIFSVLDPTPRRLMSMVSKSYEDPAGLEWRHHGVWAHGPETSASELVRDSTGVFKEKKSKPVSQDANKDALESSDLEADLKKLVVMQGLLETGNDVVTSNVSLIHILCNNCDEPITKAADIHYYGTHIVCEGCQEVLYENDVEGN